MDLPWTLFVILSFKAPIGVTFICISFYSYVNGITTLCLPIIFLNHIFTHASLQSPFFKTI